MRPGFSIPSFYLLGLIIYFGFLLEIVREEKEKRSEKPPEIVNEKNFQTESWERTSMQEI